LTLTLRITLKTLLNKYLIFIFRRTDRSVSIWKWETNHRQRKSELNICKCGP